MQILEVWLDVEGSYAGCQWRASLDGALQTCRVPLQPDGGMRWEDLAGYPLLVIEAMARWVAPDVTVLS